MPPRSKILLLPVEVRQELDRRLIAGGFSGFVELSEWLASKGYEVGKSAIHAYGQSFQDRVEKIRLATEQAKAIVEGTPDDGAAMNEALMRLVQERLFDILLQADIDPKTINIASVTKSIADLSRSNLKLKEFRRKYDAELAERMRAAGDKVAEIARESGLSAKTVKQLRREVLQITHMAVGDGIGGPASGQTQLISEKYRQPINSIRTVPDNPTYIEVEGVIRQDVGGWTVREVGVFDQAGALIAVGRYPDTYKPLLESGTGKDLYIRMILEVGNTAAVALMIDPSIVLATRQYVDETIEEKIEEHEGSDHHRIATTEQSGFIRELATLDEALAGIDDERAVTPRGLRKTIEAIPPAVTDNNTRNLVIANNAGAPASMVDVSFDAATLSTDDLSSTHIVWNQAFSIDIEINGVNGLDTGNKQASKWYYDFVILDPSSGTVAGLISLSPSAPILPAGFTHFLRLGALRTDSAGNLQGLFQYQNQASIERVTMISSMAATTANVFQALSLANVIPPIAHGASGDFGSSVGGTGTGWLMVATDETGLGSSSVNCGILPTPVSGWSLIGRWAVAVKTQQTIYWTQVIKGSTARIDVTGYLL